MDALSGIKVLDLSRLLPGPYCTLMMADYGAEVIKIEQPKIGDYIRWRKPGINGIGARHLTINRNKKSIELNLKSEEGKEIFKKMASEADVIIESFRPGVMERLGLGYEEIAKINEGIIDFKDIDWILNTKNYGVIEDLRVFLNDIKNGSANNYHLVYDNSKLLEVIKK